MKKAWTLFSLLLTVAVFADKNARLIADRYAPGVVKILVCDPKISQSYLLEDKEGYLCRGTGFFVAKEGLLLTNRHVVEWCVKGYLIADWVDENGIMHRADCLTYTAGLEKEEKIKKVYFIGHGKPMVQVFLGKNDKAYQLYEAQVLLLGENYDGALLKLTKDEDGNPVRKEFVRLPIGDSRQIAMGDDLTILGFPSMYEKSSFTTDLHDTLTMSFGTHAGWDYLFDSDGFIKTNASIHAGNSGGPVFNDAGEVIGIATGMSAKTGIGLIEQINQLYRMVEHDPDLLSSLVADGLRKSDQDRPVAVSSGAPRPLPKFEAKEKKRALKVSRSQLFLTDGSEKKVQK